MCINLGGGIDKFDGCGAWGDGLERIHLGVDFSSGPTRTSVEDDEDLTKPEHRE